MAPALSVLDLAPIAAGRSAGAALAGTTALARHAEELGFRRFWVAEHHNSPSAASTSPETLIAHVAANTGRIRVGAGGVMLPYHAPLAVAERFGMLEALHPGRIDLGLGRAPADERTEKALRSDDPGRFDEQLAELRGYLGGGHHGIRAVTGEHTLPSLWLLGSTDDGARRAARLGMAFVFAAHFHPHLAVQAVALYRELFAPSQITDRPRTIVAAGVVVGEDDEHAAALALPAAVATLWRRQGRPAPMPSAGLARALVARLSGAELAVVRDAAGRAIVGSPATVHAGLSKLVRDTQPDELMLTSPVADAELRARGLEQIAAAFEPAAAVG